MVAADHAGPGRLRGTRPYKGHVITGTGKCDFTKDSRVVETISRTHQTIVDRAPQLANSRPNPLSPASYILHIGSCLFFAHVRSISSSPQLRKLFCSAGWRLRMSGPANSRERMRVVNEQTLSMPVGSRWSCLVTTVSAPKLPESIMLGVAISTVANKARIGLAQSSADAPTCHEAFPPKLTPDRTSLSLSLPTRPRRASAACAPTISPCLLC